MFLFKLISSLASFSCHGCFAIFSAPFAAQLRFAICQHGPWRSGSRIGNGVVPLMLQEVAQHPGNGWLTNPPAVP